MDSRPDSKDPEATIAKMSRGVSAALAPAQPSGQDRAVAATASKEKLEAQQELVPQRLEELQSGETRTDEKYAIVLIDQKKSPHLLRGFDYNKDSPRFLLPRNSDSAVAHLSAHQFLRPWKPA